MALPAINLDSEFNFSAFSLPSFSEVVGNTSTRNTSRRVSARNSRVLDSSSPGPLSGRDGETSPRDGEEAKISSLDPRRLTPTLQATLVSEILNLRHEIQAKSKEMLGLEESLSSSREENGRLNKTVAGQAKDTKTLKHQMKMLEGGTMSALDDMAQERDRAVSQVADLRKRLETSQAKVKQQGDEVNRTNTQWENDQEKWSVERRALVRQVTVAEARLHTVVKEFEAVQAMHQQHKNASNVPERSNSRASRASGARSAASMRRDSSASSDGGTRNRLSHISEISRPKNVGTLADELALDDDDYYDAEYDIGEEPYSPEALPEEHRARARPYSAQSHRQSTKAFKVLGLPMEGPPDEEGGHVRDHEAHRYGAQNVDSDSQSQYSDNANQYSPPPSPKAPGIHKLDTITEASSLYTLEDPRKEHRISDPVPPIPTGFLNLRSPIMVSAGVQTTETPLSPPDTPTEKSLALATKAPVEMSSVATQTEEPEPMPVGTRKTASLGLDVPLIAIHRPNSSQSDRSVVLPPHTKSISCQASITVPVRSTAMQTEEIRIDQRPVKLPPHLLPSAISSKPSSPAPEKQKARATGVPDRPKFRAPSPVQKKSGPRMSRESKRDSTEHVALPMDGYVSDDSFISREPVKKTLSRVHDSWQVVAPNDSDGENTQPGNAVIYGSNAPMSAATSKKAAAKTKESKGKGLQVNTAKADSIRRTALVASGSAAHIQRSRSPSLPTLPSSQAKGVEPPFPVPDRSSSRKFPWEGSDGTASPTLQTVSFFGPDQDARRQRRPPVKKPGLRKIRSETAEAYGSRPRSRSPPATSASSYTELESPGITAPPLPNDDINSPFRLPSKTHRRGDSVAAASAAGSAATNDSIHVVDAIAQTMIGEWMWKYTRRRTAFGLNTDDFDARGRDGDALRHQRWVWLAPCERAVLWSSKPPVSSTALQGRLGHRKLEIQSVLDVRDDAPLPRGADPGACFGRSILILTPQRALKFTAMSRERHYLWLSALSFLSQPGIVPAEFGGIPPVPSLDELTAPPPPSRGQLERNKARQGQPLSSPLAQYPVSSPLMPHSAPLEVPKPATAFLRRHPVRDSIRVAKGKARPTFPNGGRRSHTSPVPPLAAPPLPLAEQPEESDPGCEAPHVPRTAAHTRKRSATGPRATSSFRSLGSGNGTGTGNGNGHGSTNGTFKSLASSGPTQSFRSLGSGSTASKAASLVRSRVVPAGYDSDAAADAPNAGYASRYNSMASPSSTGGFHTMTSPSTAGFHTMTAPSAGTFHAVTSPSTAPYYNLTSPSTSGGSGSNGYYSTLASPASEDPPLPPQQLNGRPSAASSLSNYGPGAFASEGTIRMDAFVGSRMNGGVNSGMGMNGMGVGMGMGMNGVLHGAGMNGMNAGGRGTRKMSWRDREPSSGGAGERSMRGKREVVDPFVGF